MEKNFKITNLQIRDKSIKNNKEKKPVLIDLTKKEDIKPVPPIKINIPKKQKEESKLPTIINLDLDSSFDTGYTTEIPAVVLKPSTLLHYQKPECLDEDSIMDTVETGFGSENILRKEEEKPKYKQHLCKENYLGEFQHKEEKKLARHNLDIYSRDEVDTLLENIINSQNLGFVTHTLVEQMLADLDFVNSTLKAISKYDVPKNLFTL